MERYGGNLTDHFWENYIQIKPKTLCQKKQKKDY